MSGQATDAIMNHRQQTTPDDEPLLEDTRSLSISGSGENPAVMVNVMSEACRIIGFPTGRAATGTEVVVEVYRDKYVVRPASEGGRDGQ